MKNYFEWDRNGPKWRVGVLAAVHVITVCFCLIEAAAAATAARTARTDNWRLQVVCFTPFDEVVDKNWPRSFCVVIGHAVVNVRCKI